jgi:hypothetical protein
VIFRNGCEPRYLARVDNPMLRRKDELCNMDAMPCNTTLQLQACLMLGIFTDDVITPLN